jgi:hypothetical protein
MKYSNFDNFIKVGSIEYATVLEGHFFASKLRGIFRQAVSWRFMNDGTYCPKEIENLWIAYIAAQNFKEKKPSLKNLYYH